MRDRYELYCAGDSVCGTLPAMKKSDLQKYFAKLGKKGGPARAKKLTAEERSESARKAAQARWKKKVTGNAP